LLFMYAIKMAVRYSYFTSTIPHRLLLTSPHICLKIYAEAGGRRRGMRYSSKRRPQGIGFVAGICLLALAVGVATLAVLYVRDASSSNIMADR
jgi:hypothetical protein